MYTLTSNLVMITYYNPLVTINNNLLQQLCFAFYSQESRESQVSAAASAVDEQATGPLFSDRTEDTDKTITRYSVVTGTYCLS